MSQASSGNPMVSSVGPEAIQLAKEADLSRIAKSTLDLRNKEEQGKNLRLQLQLKAQAQQQEEQQDFTAQQAGLQRQHQQGMQESAQQAEYNKWDKYQGFLKGQQESKQQHQSTLTKEKAKQDLDMLEKQSQKANEQYDKIRADQLKDLADGRMNTLKDRRDKLVAKRKVWEQQQAGIDAVHEKWKPIIEGERGRREEIAAANTQSIADGAVHREAMETTKAFLPSYLTRTIQAPGTSPTKGGGDNFLSDFTMWATGDRVGDVHVGHDGLRAGEASAYMEARVAEGASIEEIMEGFEKGDPKKQRGWTQKGILKEDSSVEIEGYEKIPEKERTKFQTIDSYSYWNEMSKGLEASGTDSAMMNGAKMLALSSQARFEELNGQDNTATLVEINKLKNAGTSDAASKLLSARKMTGLSMAIGFEKIAKGEMDVEELKDMLPPDFYEYAKDSRDAGEVRQHAGNIANRLRKQVDNELNWAEGYEIADEWDQAYETAKNKVASFALVDEKPKATRAAEYRIWLDTQDMDEGMREELNRDFQQMNDYDIVGLKRQYAQEIKELQRQATEFEGDLTIEVIMEQIEALEEEMEKL